MLKGRREISINLNKVKIIINIMIIVIAINIVIIRIIEINTEILNSILKMDVVENVWKLFQEVENLVYVKYLDQFVKLSYQNKVVKYVGALVVIQEIMNNLFKYILTVNLDALFLVKKMRLI